MNAYAFTRGEADLHISRSGVQKRIRNAVIADKLHRDRTRPSFDLRSAAEVEQLHTSSSGRDSHRTARAPQPNTAALRIGLDCAFHVSQIQVAAAAGHMQIADALLNLDTAGARLNRRRVRRA